MAQKKKILKNKKLKFIDLFAGIGGFHLGIKKAAKKIGVVTECVLAVDIDDKVQATYTENFKHTKFLKDITDPYVKEIIPKNVDIICAGFPCQPFSQAGKKRGMEDDRGTLFKHIIEILKKKKPKVIFLENVRNLLNIKNADGTKTIDIIKMELERVGYPISIQPLRATQFGLPTHRPRIYMIGFRKDIMISPPRFEWWPLPTCKKAPTLDEYFKKLNSHWDNFEICRDGWPSRIGNTLRVGGVGSAFKNGKWRVDRRTWDAYMFFENDKEGSKRKKPHKLSVDEAKAMMGFPHNFKFPEHLSDYQKMRQLGNSVAVPVIEEIAKKIIKTINKNY